MLEKLDERMKAGVVQFVFKKADGTLRPAFGTLNPKVIQPLMEIGTASPKIVLLDKLYQFIGSKEEGVTITKESGIFKDIQAVMQPSGEKSSKAPNPELKTYFDLDAMAWRSFKIDSLVRIVE